MFSSKKKNVELNLMFISQANNIGNSEIPFVHRIFHKFSRVSRKAVTGCVEAFFIGIMYE